MMSSDRGAKLKKLRNLESAAIADHVELSKSGLALEPADVTNCEGD